MLQRTARLLIGSLMGLSLWLPAASGQGLEGFGAAWAGDLDPAARCPTRFDFEVLASAADSGKLLDLSAYQFRRETRYSAVPLSGFQRVGGRRLELACQGGDVAGMRARAAARRSSQIT
jgi:hypothetical protein